MYTEKWLWIKTKYLRLQLARWNNSYDGKSKLDYVKTEDIKNEVKV